MQRSSRVVLSLVIAIAAACATSSRAAPADPPVLTGEEIASISVATAYDAVARLRPGYLRTTGGRAQLVYMNTHVVGGVDALRDIPAFRVQEIRYLSPSEATSRLGVGHEGGAIIVVTRRTN